MSLKLYALMLCLATIIYCATAEAPLQKEANTTAPPSDAAQAAAAADSATDDTLSADDLARSARMVKYLTDPKSIGARRPTQQQQQQQIRQRADFGGAALPLGTVPKRLPNAYARPQLPPAFPPRPQVLRRVHNNAPPPPPPRFSYEPPQKSSYYSPLKLGPQHYANGGVFGKGHNSVAPGSVLQRPQYANPNALPHPHAPSQLQQQQQQQQQHFKASPPFNGQAIVRPAAEKQQQPQAEAYPKQYALPQPQQQQQPQVFPNSIPGYPQPPASASPLQRQQQYQYAYQQQQQQLTAPPGGPKMYSVYEEPEHADHASLQLNSQQQYGAAALSSADMLAARQAQDYIKFMNSNDYFLPKRDPNYRQLDAEKDRQQQQPPQYPQQHYHLQQQQQQQQQQRFGPAPAPAPPAFNQQQQQQQQQQPIQVASLFHYQQAQPQQPAQSESSAAAAIVRGSYQTGNNMFVVNSDGNKAVHHIVASPLPTQQLLEVTTPTTVTSQRGELRYSAAHRRTPEPLRFEFTENDAMPSAVTAYTSAPQLRYNSNNNNNGNSHRVVSSTRAPSIISSSLPAVTKSTILYASRKSATEPSVLGSGSAMGTGSGSGDDDIEDGDDMHDERYTRKPTKIKTKKLSSSSSPANALSPSSSSSSSSSSTTSTTPAPADKQDTEDYCERMCAIVHDDNAEIVCGSDGYMYTSEAQMECYASCLHIDVTIQSKGSCSER